MATLDSDKADAALETKMACEVDRKKKDHNYFYVKDGATFLASTKISKGAKHTLTDNLVSIMGKQLKLGGSNFAKSVNCTIGRDEAIAIIRSSLGLPAAEKASQQADSKTASAKAAVSKDSSSGRTWPTPKRKPEGR